ncbi:hypothetical protein JNW88_08205 [Micromonospora sp. ATA32]|nr:hypothetical protein [Micromonospora sp. ATA32]
MGMWHEAADALSEAIDSEKTGRLTTDQQLKVAEIKALLAIGQELSKIHHEGINPEYDSGH